MKRFPLFAFSGRLLAVAALSLLVASCAASSQPRPQMTSVVDPATLPGGVRTPEWDLGAVRYRWTGSGLNYFEAGLLPVILIVHNHSNRVPVIYAQECRGVGPGGAEYPPYSMEQAAEVVFASTAYQKSAEAAVVGGLTGAAVGAGLGALIGSGFNGGWGAGPGALIGAGIGAVGGAALSQRPSMDQYRASLYQEMATYAWRPNPIPPTSIIPGYLYFPSNLPLSAVHVTLRIGNQIQSYIVPIDNPAW